MNMAIFIILIFLFSNDYRDKEEFSYQDNILEQKLKASRGENIKTIKKDVNVNKKEEIYFYFDKDEIENYKMEKEVIILGDGRVRVPGDGSICYENKSDNTIYSTHRVILTFYNDDEIMYGVIDVNVNNNIKDEIFIDFRYGD
ncbi:hypothetical protein [Vibrio metschnikovii]|uniref:hypothetical protein n=1 Tax=Vibrio metschnikovii TaxID=28172 RepID=UPI002FC9F003